MAEFKTAEQYVVEKLETTERELYNLRIAVEVERDAHLKEFGELREELHDAYALLDLFRDFLIVRKSSYFGNCVELSSPIYEKENPNTVARIMEYFDMRPEEDDV